MNCIAFTRVRLPPEYPVPQPLRRPPERQALRRGLCSWTFPPDLEITMDKTTRGWVEAGKILSSDPAAKVMCPTCRGEFVQVEDHPHGKDAGLVDRYMTCDACGAREVIVRLRKDPM